MNISIIKGHHLTTTDKTVIRHLIENGMESGQTRNKMQYFIRPTKPAKGEYAVKIRKKVRACIGADLKYSESDYLIKAT